MQRISIHRFLFNAILFRMYSKKETYKALEPFSRNANVGSHHTKDPDWIGMKKKLTELYAAPTPVWGGMFYPATLIATESSNGNWKYFKNISCAKDKVLGTYMSSKAPGVLLLEIPRRRHISTRSNGVVQPVGKQTRSKPVV